MQSIYLIDIKKPFPAYSLFLVFLCFFPIMFRGRGEFNMIPFSSLALEKTAFSLSDISFVYEGKQNFQSSLF